MMKMVKSNIKAQMNIMQGRFGLAKKIYISSEEYEELIKDNPHPTNVFTEMRSNERLFYVFGTDESLSREERMEYIALLQEVSMKNQEHHLKNIELGVWIIAIIYVLSFVLAIAAAI